MNDPYDPRRDRDPREPDDNPKRDEPWNDPEDSPFDQPPEEEPDESPGQEEPVRRDPDSREPKRWVSKASNSAYSFSPSRRSAIRYSLTTSPPRRCSFRMRSSTGGSQWPYQVPSG